MTTQIFAGAAAASAGSKGGLFRRTPRDAAWTAVTAGLPENADAGPMLPDRADLDLIDLPSSVIGFIEKSYKM